MHTEHAHTHIHTHAVCSLITEKFLFDGPDKASLNYKAYFFLFLRGIYLFWL